MIITPPQNREKIYKKLIDNNINIISEKPISNNYFEIKKLGTQLLLYSQSYNFKNLHLSVLKSTLERTIQFGIYNKHMNKPEEAIAYSSLGVTAVNIPYFYKIIKSNFALNPKINKIRLLNYTTYIASKTLFGSFIFMYNFDYAKRNRINEYAVSFVTSTCIWYVVYPIDTIFHRYLIGNNKYNNLYKGIQYPIMRNILNTICGLFVYNKINHYIEQY